MNTGAAKAHQDFLQEWMGGSKPRSEAAHDPRQPHHGAAAGGATKREVYHALYLADIARAPGKECPADEVTRVAVRYLHSHAWTNNWE
jgi:truncated hemoglobin YjbI